MSLNLVPAGNNLPHEFNVIIEIPAQSDPIKYEVDKDSGAMFVDRFMGAPMHYPCNYGYIPNTLSEDGDPIDVLVRTPHKVIPGCVIRCRALGVLQMEDESGIDHKILALPVSKLTPFWDHVKTWEDIPPVLIRQIEHFFEHYKDLEAGKWVKIKGWDSKEAAQQSIMEAVAAHQKDVEAV